MSDYLLCFDKSIEIRRSILTVNSEYHSIKMGHKQQFHTTKARYIRLVLKFLGEFMLNHGHLTLFFPALSSGSLGKMRKASVFCANSTN